ELDPADAYDAYRLQVRDPGGAVVFDRANLRATADGEARAIAAEIPAGSLRSGAYEIAVAGIDDGTAEDLGFQTLRVRRR
ncbi:MAG TPA: hypothetical protein VGF40_13435, partial [Thermoanaerobaculia bacterium]